MSKILTNSATPAHIGHNFISDDQEYDYGQIGKGIIHVWVIPFLIAFIAAEYSLVYIACVTLLYSTVFRDKSDGFFGVLGISLAIIAIMIIPN